MCAYYPILVDPIVLAHARALLTCNDRTIAVPGDARKPEALLADDAVRTHLDFQQPIAVLFMAVLHFLTPDDDAAHVISAVLNALAPGSYLVVSHAADLPDTPEAPGRAEATQAAAKAYRELAAPCVLRTREEIAGWFDGLELVAPGLVPVNDWRPRRERPGSAVPVLACLGRLPGSGRTRALR
jgi:hypothetical protein